MANTTTTTTTTTTKTTTMRGGVQPNDLIPHRRNNLHIFFVGRVDGGWMWCVERLVGLGLGVGIGVGIVCSFCGHFLAVTTETQHATRTNRNMPHAAATDL